MNRDLDNVTPLSAVRGERESSQISLEDQDDDTLMLMVRSGESRAFDTLVRRYQRMVLGTALKYLGDPVAAEDAAQASLLDLFRHADRYRPQGKFRSFLAAIVLNNCRMAERRTRGERHFSRKLEALHAAAEQEFVNAFQVEQRRALHRALQTLRPKLREAVVLRHVAGLSYQEISETLGIRLGTVKSRIFAAVEALSRALEAEER